MVDTNRQIFDLFASTLRETGLGELFTVDANGNPGGWLWNQIQAGVDTYEAFAAAFEATDVFRNRFSVITEQKRLAAQGKPVQVMTPQEVISYEKQLTEQFTEAGIPSWFYDEPEDFNEYILRNISPAEIKRRTEQVFEYVDNAPPEVQQAFREYYGVGQSRGALAAFVLDPDRTAARVEKARDVAFVGGMAKRFDIDLNKSRAKQLAELGMSETAVVSNFTELNRRAALFRESRFEDGDLTANDEGVAAVFEGDADATAAINRRLIERQAVNRVSTGGAIETNQGLVGARTAGGR